MSGTQGSFYRWMPIFLDGMHQIKLAAVVGNGNLGSSHTPPAITFLNDPGLVMEFLSLNYLIDK